MSYGSYQSIYYKLLVNQIQKFAMTWALFFLVAYANLLLTVL